MSNSQISTFNFKSNPVRIEVINNEPHFCLTDVCSALSINNANSSRFNFNEKGIHLMYTLTKGGKQELTFINEPNLYRIIFKSRKAEAVEFQNWVFEEVLPQIRKTGKYNTQPQQSALPEPEKKFTFELTQDNIHDLVWLLFSHGQMNWLLGRLIKPLQALGSSFSPAVYSHHVEYQRHHRDCLPIIKQFIEPLKQANPQEWQRLQNRLNDK
ncbi:BRO family protein [Basfia succiniciproducens]|uniref:BRO family protein n=1 Tax=Basfia succiniciproducens TaxID=653940 RepID=UPI0008D7B733|nr:BRO family protein [Basfia succiniciproducens]SEQ65170.1 Prophage antirepressor [Basfia succiniciproducens]